MALERSPEKVRSWSDNSNNNFPPHHAPPPKRAGAYYMHVLQAIVNHAVGTRLVSVEYNNDTREIIRYAIFEFDSNLENAAEIEYELYPVLVNTTMLIMKEFIQEME